MASGTFKLYDYGGTQTLLFPYESDGGLDVTHLKNRGQIQATPDLPFRGEHEGKFSFKCRLMEIGVSGRSV